MEHPHHPSKSQSHSNQQLISHLALIGPLAALLVLLVLGPLALAALILFACFLSANPDWRQIVDASLGLAPSPEHRLRACFPPLPPPVPTGPPLTQSEPDLSQIPAPLLAAFSPLIDIIIRDYVEFWYQLPSVSTGDRAFLNQLRAALHHVLATAYAKVSAKSSKETLIYLLGCLSMNLVRHIRLPPSNEPPPPQESNARFAQRALQVRRISQEILLTVAPPSITVSPILLSLLSEILSVQLITAVNALDDDLFNQTIINSLGSSLVPVPSTPLDSESPSTPQQTSIHLPASSLILSPTTDSMSLSSDGPVTGHQILSLYLKSTPDLLSSPSRPSTINPLPKSISKLLESTPVWSPTSEQPPPMNSLLHQSSSSNPTNNNSLETFSTSEKPQAQSLLRIWTQLDSFRRISQMTDLESELLKSDALSLLGSLSTLLHQAISDTDEPTWCQVVVETLRRLERPHIDGATVFLNLQEWILDLIQRIESSPSTPKQRANLVATANDERVCYMVMPFVPPSSSDEPLGEGHQAWNSRPFSSSPSPSTPAKSRPPLTYSDSHPVLDEGPEEESDMTEGYCCDDPELPSARGATEPGASEHVRRSPVDMGPTFTVSVTDISPATAVDVRGQIKQKRELEFLIAVEVSHEPGFIVTRKWPELDRMEAGLAKLKWAGLGTAAFPRALLPSHLNLKTVEHVVRELEGYLATLLNDERYAQSQPVLTFFARERSGSTAKNNALGSLVSTWDSFGKGVVSVGKEVTKPVNLATQGFSQLSKGVLAGLPFGNSKDGRPSEEHGQPIESAAAGEAGSSIGKRLVVESKSINNNGGQQQQEKRASLQDRFRQFSFTSSSPASPEPHILQESFSATSERSSDGSLVSSESLSVGPRPSSLSVSDSIKHLEQRETPSQIAGQIKGFTVDQDPVEYLVSPPLPCIPNPPSTCPPRVNEKREEIPDAQRGKVPFQQKIDSADFEAILIALMSVLEAAYGLEDSEPSWSVRRGMLRVLETVLRTTSLNSQLKTAVIKILDQVNDPIKISEWVKSMTNAMTWNPNHDHKALAIDKSLKAKEERRVLARKLWIDSWSGLKIGLGSNATEVAAGRVFDVFQKDQEGQEGGSVKIFHSVLMDLIRIVLLL